MNLESTTQLSKQSNKPEKSQEELRVILEQKIESLKPSLQQGIAEYKQALKDGVFEDAEGEEEGLGERRKEALQKKLNSLFDRVEKMKKRLDSQETLSQITSDISTPYTHPDGKKEIITLDLEAKLQDFISFYQKTNIDLPPDFEEIIRDIWERNQTEIEQAIEQNGFDEILLIPANIPLLDLAEKMKMEDGYYEGSDFKAGGSFAGAVSPNVDKPRIILVHKTQNLKDRPELEQTLNTKGEDVQLDQALALEDYLIFHRKYFEETLQVSGGQAGKHLDEDDWTWLATKSGTRLVHSTWNPDHRKLDVNAYVLDFQFAYLGVRPSRCFF